MDLGLAGRVALVTGGYRGIGAGIGAVLAREGAHVLVHGFEPGQPDEVVAALRDAGGTADGVVGGAAAGRRRTARWPRPRSRSPAASTCSWPTTARPAGRSGSRPTPTAGTRPTRST